MKEIEIKINLRNILKTVWNVSFWFSLVLSYCVILYSLDGTDDFISPFSLKIACYVFLGCCIIIAFKFIYNLRCYKIKFIWEKD